MWARRGELEIVQGESEKGDSRGLGYTPVHSRFVVDNTTLHQDFRCRCGFNVVQFFHPEAAQLLNFVHEIGIHSFSRGFWPRLLV